MTILFAWWNPWTVKRMRQKGCAKLQFFHRASWRITVRTVAHLRVRLPKHTHCDALRVFLIGKHCAPFAHIYTQVNDISSAFHWLARGCVSVQPREWTQRMGLFLFHLFHSFSLRLDFSHSGSSCFFSFARSFAGTKYNTRLSTRFHHQLPHIAATNGKNSNFHYSSKISQSYWSY